MKKILALICFTSLALGLLIQVSTFHVCEHHDSEDHSGAPCENCLLVIDSHKFEGIVTSIESLKLFIPEHPSILGLVFSDTWRKNKKVVTSFHVRPPPPSLIKQSF